MIDVPVIDWDARADAFPEFWSRVDIRGPRECWEWTGARSTHGYGLVGVRVLRAFGERFAHRVVCEAMHIRGQTPDQNMVLHGCDNPPCCNPRHLRYGDAGDNTRDRETAAWMARAIASRNTGDDVPGLNARSSGLPGPFSRNPLGPGVPHHNAKFTEKQVRAIRADFDAGIAVRDIAIKHGVNVSSAHAIAKRHSWKHIP